MVEIRPLQRFEEAEFRQVVRGYRSFSRHNVQKQESPGCTVIRLDESQLETPYQKVFNTSPDEINHYRSLLVHNLSLGAYAGEQLTGICVAEPHQWNRSVWVWEFHVREDFQRQGIGKKMMEKLAGLARSAGFRNLVCETQNTNAPAIAFYRRIGFEIEGIDLSYYTNHDLPDGAVAIFMKLKLE